MPIIQTAPSESPHGDLNVQAPLQVREYSAIVARIAADAPNSILDWGCGHGQMSSMLRARGLNVSAFDYRPADADGELHPLRAFPEISALWGDDPVTLPYDDGSFAAVLSCGVLEHVQNPRGSLRELHRVLKPGGKLYVYKLPNRASWTEWIARRLRGKVFYHGMAAYDHLYRLGEARALLAGEGFEVLEARYTNAVPLMLPVTLGERTASRLWSANALLSRMPGIKLVANNVELVARAV